MLASRIAAAPLLVLGGTLVQRRYGQAIGGRLVGLPLTSLPLLALVAAADGRTFAAAAATATLAAVVAQTAWCWTYAKAASRGAGLWPTLMRSSVAFAAWSLLLYVLRPSLAVAVVAGPLSILAALRWWPRAVGAGEPGTGSGAELAARMVAGGAFMVGVTEASRSLGPSGAGLVGAYPVLTVVLAVATHRRDGAPGAVAFLRGVTQGSGSLVAGVATVALGIGPLGPAVAFPLAVAASLTVQLASTGMFRRPAPAAT